MKKNTFKKSLSLFMAVLMLMTCWVWIAPEKAAASFELSYPLSVKVNNETKLNNGGNIQVYYYKINDDGTLDTSTLLQYNFVNSLTRDKGATPTYSGNIPGFPVKIAVNVANYTWGTDKMGVKVITVGNKTIFNDNYTIQDNQTINWEKGVTLGSWNPSGTWENPSWSSSSTLSGYSVQVPTYGSRTVTSSTKAAWADQYSVAWPQDKVSYSVGGTGVSLSQSSGTLTGVTVGADAIGNFDGTSQTKNVTITASGAGKTQTANVTLTAPNKDVLYDNLFSLSDWYYSDSSKYSDSNVKTDLSKGTITITNPTTDTSTEYTTSSDTGKYTSNRYAIDLEAGNTYYFMCDTSGGAQSTEVFMMYKKADGTAISFESKYFSGVAKNNIWEFTAPAETAKAEIRFDNNTDGTTATFSNIAVYKKVDADKVDLTNWTTRPAGKSYAYAGAIGSTLDVPARKGYAFNGWYLDSDANGIHGDGETITDGTGKVVTNTISKITQNYTLKADWTRIPYDLGYDNLFSLAEWSKTTSVKPSNSANGTIAYDVEAGTITAESTANGEVYSTYGTGKYFIPVEPNTEYIFEADMNLDKGDKGQMFVFFYDANGNGLAGSIYNGTEQTQPHIGIYPTSDGTQSIIFTTPASCTKMAVRVGATNVGTKATYSNIGFYEKASYDAYAKNYDRVREAFYYGDTKSLMNPSRDNAEFLGWFTADGKQITSLEGLDASTVVYAHWAVKAVVTFENTSVKVELTPGTAITADQLPDNPSKTPDANYHYTFKGWFTADGKEIKAGTVIDSDVTAKAEFTATAHGDYEYEYLEDATCTKAALVNKKCGTCKCYVAEKIDYDGDDANRKALGHNYDTSKGATIVQQSGTEAGHTVRCSRYYDTEETCGGETTVAHVWPEDPYKTEGATCSQKGTNYYRCPCGYEKTEEGEYAPNVHNYDYSTAISNGDGTHTVACKDNSTHTKEVTCTDENKNCFCDVCNQELTHNYKNKTKTNLASAAGCGKDAVYYLTCQCGKYGEATWTDEGTALGHSFTNYVSNNDAKCGVNGTETAKCDRCDATDTRTDDDSALEHVFKGAVKDNKDGTHSYKCTNGDCDVYGGTVDCTYGDWIITDTDHKHTCNDCGYTTEAEKHIWGDWTPSKDNTDEEAGKMTHTCTVCGKTAEGDCNYEQTDYKKETCLAPEITTYKCKDCGHGYTVIGAPATGHNFKDENCEVKSYNNGTHSFKCLNCNVYGYDVSANAVAPCEYKYTAAEGDEHTATCTVCSYSTTEDCAGGTATCTAAAVCDKCKDTHGDKADHFFKGDAVKLEGDVHAYLCEFCGKTTGIYGVGNTVKATEDCKGGTATCIALAVCDKCKDTHGGYADHVITGTEKYLFKATDATCVANETYYKYCIVCKAVHSDETYEKPNSTISHDYICKDEYLYIATQAECGVNETYYAYCSNADCKKSSEDAANTFEKADTALEHNYNENIISDGKGTHTIECSQTNTDGWACTETITLNCADSAISYGYEAPSCTEKGYTIYQCAACNYTWNADYENAKGHDYSTRTLEHLKSAATCESPAIYWLTCSACGKNAEDETDSAYTDLTFTYGSKREHDWAEIVKEDNKVSSATCTAKAVYYKSCAYEDCGAVSTETFEYGDELGHAWAETERYLAAPADCVNDAVYYKECTRTGCGISSKGETDETWTKADSKTGHDFDHDDDEVIGNEGDTGYTAGVENDCENDGVLEHYTCSVCNKNFADEEGKTEILGSVIINKLGHSYTIKVEKKDATCEEDGHTAYEECANANCHKKNYKYEVITKTGHNFVASAGYIFDAEKDTHAYKCSNGCGAFGIDGEKDKVTECSFGDYTHEVADGIHYHSQSCVCGNIEKAECTEKEAVVTAPTCTEGGYTTHECAVCGETWITDETDALDHDFTGGIIANNDGTHSIMCKRDGCDYKSEAVACTTEKEENKATACGQKNKCDVCGVEYGEALAHTWTQSTDYVKTAATCTTKAVYYMVCSTCTKSANELGEEDNTWTGKALGHDMQDYTYDISGWKFVPDTLDVSAIKEPTCCADGMQISYCSRCSEYTTKIKAKDATAHIWETAEDSEDGLKWVKQGGDCIVGVTYTNKCIVVGCTEVQTKKETGGHQWGITHYEYPTCTEEGYIQETCSVCSFQKDRFYDKNMHEKLGDKYENAELAPLGHDVKESTEVAGTCISSGYTVGICDRCGNEAIEETDVYGDHTWKDVAAVEATCEKDGYSAHKLCKICGETEGKTTEAKTGHNDKDGDGKCDDCNRVPTENGKSCGCICHKTSGIMKIFYKILNFFWKLFKISKSCDCGNVHW